MLPLYSLRSVSPPAGEKKWGGGIGPPGGYAGRFGDRELTPAARKTTS